MKICVRCFQGYDPKYSVCPHCGYSEKDNPLEPQYLPPGTLLASHYLIGAVIGSGGFGVTYAAWDQTLEMRVAIKEFLPGEFSTRIPGQTAVTVYGGEKTEQFETGRNKFMDESRHLAKLQGIPGIVQIYNSFEENGTAYIVMEYLEGETLDQKLKREKRIPEQEAVKIMLPVLQALETVHKQGLLHRDIAPNNIFLTKEGEAKLLDFGASRSATGSHSKSLTVLYKEGYTAEEQYQSHGNQGAWTDVYASAATLYKMLTGITPPGALERRRKDTLREPSRLGVKVSRQVENALMNALNVDIRNRTQSAMEFAEQLSGKTKVKEHFVRTIEKQVGEIPLRIKVLVLLLFSGMFVFLGCLFTGVISFRIEAFGNFLVPDGQTRVPNVVNKEVEEAQELLQDRMLSIRITDKQFSEEIPRDRILFQDSEAGSIVQKGAYIGVVISGGEKNEKNGYKLANGETFVPDIQYKSLEEAQELINAAGLIADARYRQDDNVEEGRIIEQEKKAGSVAKEGETLIFYVSGENSTREETEQVEEAIEEQKTDNNLEEEYELLRKAAGIESTATETESVIESEDQSTWIAEVEETGGHRSQEAQQLLNYINQYRLSAGIASLNWNKGLEASAQIKAELMAEGQGFNVVSGNYAVDRQKSYSENIGIASVISDLLSQDELLRTDITEMGGTLFYYPKSQTPYIWSICLN